MPAPLASSSAVCRWLQRAALHSPVYTFLRPHHLRPRSRARMMHAMHRLQPPQRQVRIHLRRRNIGVAQESTARCAGPRHAPPCAWRNCAAAGAGWRRCSQSSPGAKPIAASAASRAAKETAAPHPAAMSLCAALALLRELMRARCGRPSRRYFSRASIAVRPSGTIRSLSPLPRTCTRPASSARSPVESAVTSDTRSPPA